MPIKRKQKFLIIIKLVVFNTFFTGFVANLIAFLNSNWLETDTYCYGLFEYCRKVDSTVSYLILDLNEKRLVHNLFTDLQCVSWSHTRPKFLNQSIYCLSFALILHFSTMFFIVIFTLAANNSFATSYSSMIRFFKFIKKYSVKEWLGSIIGISLSIAYGSHLTAILLGKVFNRAENKIEGFGWCFWLSCVGFLITLLPVLIVSIHTFLTKHKIYKNVAMRKQSSFESDSLSYESFNGLFNIRNTEFNKIFYSEAFAQANSQNSINQNHDRCSSKKINFLESLLKRCPKKKIRSVKRMKLSKKKTYKTVASYDFLKKALPALRQSDIYEPVVDNVNSQIYSVVKIPTYAA